jgi:hypothetical protein
VTSSDFESRCMAVIRGFYGLVFLAVVVALARKILVAMTVGPPEWPVEILSWIPAIAFDPLSALCVAAVLVFALIACLNPLESRWARLGVALSLLFLVGLASSYGKVFHSFHGIIFAAFVLALMPLRRGDSSMGQAVFLAQLSAVLGYGMAGLWKVRTLVEVGIDGGLAQVLESLSNAIAFEHLRYSHELRPISAFFMDNVELTGFMFFGLVALQTLSPVLVWVRSLHLWLGLGLLLFHILSEVIVSIPFRPQTGLVILLLIGSPFTDWTAIRNRLELIHKKLLNKIDDEPISQT